MLPQEKISLLMTLWMISSSILSASILYFTSERNILGSGVCLVLIMLISGGMFDMVRRFKD